MFILNPYSFTTAVNNSMFSTLAWIGNGSTQSITGVGFQPDLVIVRPMANSNTLWIDSTRGGTKILEADPTQTAEITDANAISSFDSDGFSLGNSTRVNTNNTAYFALCFKKDSGFFDIVSFTGNATNRTVSHALSAAPEMMVLVNLTDAATADWPVYHVGMDASAPETYYMFANQTTGRSTALSTYWNDTAPTSSNFSVGTNNATNGSGDSMIAYLWKSNSDYAKFGSYTGNGSSTGPTISGLGFEPYVAWIKNYSAYDWTLVSRGLGYNDTPTDSYITNDNAASSSKAVQFNSSSFQLKTTDSTVNLAATKHIYAAFKPKKQAGYWLYDGNSTLASTSFVVPTAVTNIKRVRAIGNGGQGQTSTTLAGGDGGGGGGYCLKANHAVSAGASLSLSVGGNNSTTNTVFDTITAGYGASGASGGTAGTASGGDTNTNGTAGSAHSLLNGGAGGASGSGASGGNGGTGGNAGSAGALNGGGGGGGGTDGVSTFSGGNGRRGLLEIIW